jgi:glycosyltransferase involved in cell wall biosynthesis
MPERPERVLLLLPSLTGLGGGIELYTRQFLEALARARPEAELVTVLAREAELKRPGLLSTELRARLRVLGTERAQRLARIGEFVALAGWAATLRPQLVVCGHVNFVALGHLLARVNRAGLLAITHGVEAWNLPPASRTARALRAADRVIAVSRYTADQLERSIGVEPSRLRVVNNAVDVARFTPGQPSRDVAARLAHLPRPRLLTVCRLDASDTYKGVDTVLRTLAANPGLAGSYLVVGDGSDLDRLKQLARALKVDATFYGRATDEELVDLYRASDLFVMPSRKEGFGYVFIEAMAAGVPVVAGGADGSVDALGGGDLGLLIDPLDERQLADAIRAQLSGATPAHLRDGARLHAEVERRFGHARFERRVGEVLP